MLEDDYHRNLTDRLAKVDCLVQVPRSLQKVLSCRGVKPTMAEDSRRFARFSCPEKTLLEVKSTIACIPRSPEIVAILRTDISREGVAFLHSAELFPGEVSLIWFHSGKVACRVVRCLRHNSSCFEIGARFEDGPQTSAWLQAVISEKVAESTPFA